MNVRAVRSYAAVAAALMAAWLPASGQSPMTPGGPEAPPDPKMPGPKAPAAKAPAVPGTPDSRKALANPLDPPRPVSMVLVGPTFGVNRNFHTGGFRVIDEPNCPVFRQGTGWGFLVGITAELQLGDSWGLISRVTYESRPGLFRQDLDNMPVLLPVTGGEPEIISQSVSASSTITYSLLNMEVLYKQEFWEPARGVRISAVAGPAVGYVLGGKNHQVQTLEQPDNARFIPPPGVRSGNGGRTLIFFDGDIPERNPIRVSLKAGLQAEVGLFNYDWMMCPGVYYDFGLTPVTTAETWKLSTLMAQIDFRRAF